MMGMPAYFDKIKLKTHCGETEIVCKQFYNLIPMIGENSLINSSFKKGDLIPAVSNFNFIIKNTNNQRYMQLNSNNRLKSVSWRKEFDWGF